MRSFFKENKDALKTQEEEKVRQYISKYLKELQRHFDMPDDTMRSIIYKIYQDLSPYHFLKIFMKNKLDMLKSFCEDKFRKY